MFEYDCNECKHQGSEECEECTNLDDRCCSCHIAPPCSYCVGNNFEEKESGTI